MDAREGKLTDWRIWEASWGIIGIGMISRERRGDEGRKRAGQQEGKRGQKGFPFLIHLASLVKGPSRRTRQTPCCINRFFVLSLASSSLSFGGLFSCLVLLLLYP